MLMALAGKLGVMWVCGPKTFLTSIISHLFIMVMVMIKVMVMVMESIDYCNAYANGKNNGNCLKFW